MTTPTRPTTVTTSTPASSRWEQRAACADRLDLPWLTDTGDVTRWDALTMRSVCDTCPVRAACAAAVADLDVTGGWWAGQDRDPNALTATSAPAFVQPALPLDLPALPLLVPVAA